MRERARQYHLGMRDGCEKVVSSPMSFAQLQYFIVVAEEQNLTRAALRLHISQPPLSRQIKSLEEELGVSLFERSKSGMSLLPRGEQLLREAREITDRVRALPRLVERGDSGSKPGLPEKPSSRAL